MIQPTPTPKPMPYVVACGDEGVQVNEGRRLAFAGSGYKLPGFSQVVPLIKELFGQDIRVVSCQENDWIKKQLELANWHQVNAMTQQHVAAMADKEGLLYSGYFPFADPKQLEHQVKGHMVRPHDVHIANKISFTVAGGEQKFNLGCFVISADWVHLAPKKLIEQVIMTQVEFYRSISSTPLTIVFEETGALSPEIAAENKKRIQALGL